MEDCRKIDLAQLKDFQEQYTKYYGQGIIGLDSTYIQVDKDGLRQLILQYKPDGKDFSFYFYNDGLQIRLKIEDLEFYYVVL